MAEIFREFQRRQEEKAAWSEALANLTDKCHEVLVSPKAQRRVPGYPHDSFTAHFVDGQRRFALHTETDSTNQGIAITLKDLTSGVVPELLYLGRFVDCQKVDMGGRRQIFVPQIMEWGTTRQPVLWNLPFSVTGREVTMSDLERYLKAFDKATKG